MSEPESGRASGPLEATVLRVMFSGADGVFAVARVEIAGRPGPTTAVGPLGSVAQGDVLRVEGTWERHDRFGDQLRVEHATPVVPHSELGVERYLASLHGIGRELAKRLVIAFGTRAVETVAEQPMMAAKVRGVGKKRALAASAEAKARIADREVMMFLQGHGVSAAYASRIRKRWGDQAIARVRENPYRLAREVSGIGFAVADRIARGMGIKADSPLRIEAALYHTLETLSDEGHCYAPAALLIERAATQLAKIDGGEMVADVKQLDPALESLVLHRAVIREEPDLIWLPWLHSAEVQLANQLQHLLSKAKPLPPPKREGRAARELARLSEGQRVAVDRVRKSGVAVITGGPGTGKTTVMKATVALWEEAGRRVVLAAPTGRAAKRLSEATGKQASTVHRLLEWNRGGGGRGKKGAGASEQEEFGARGSSAWGRGEGHPLDADLVVVDEASMLDVSLARALAAAVPVGSTLLLVGDVDQLPSVGPGQVLADVIASGAVAVARLTEIFRQAEGSRIVQTAHGVLAGAVPSPSLPDAAESAESDASRRGPPRSDFYVIPVEDGAAARERVIKLCRERIPRAFGLDSRADIQVLTPMHRGEAGTTELNRALQATLNPDGAELARGNRAALRVGDKVMQARNDYDRDVWNGDIGEVASIDAEQGSAVVTFDERPVDYDRDALDQLELAYAVSIHKSQGSEYPAVVITLLPEHFMLLRRNLLYTAITRGKRLVVIVGSPRALRRAVETADAERRYTRLRERLRS